MQFWNLIDDLINSVLNNCVNYLIKVTKLLFKKYIAKDINPNVNLYNLLSYYFACLLTLIDY